jgi:hypothetical protein
MRTQVLVRPRLPDTIAFVRADSRFPSLRSSWLSPAFILNAVDAL